MQLLQPLLLCVSKLITSFVLSASGWSLGSNCSVQEKVTYVIKYEHEHFFWGRQTMVYTSGTRHKSFTREM